MAEIYQVEFKGSRRELFFNSYYHSLNLNEYVITQVEQGEHIGRLTKKIEADMDFSGSRRPRSILRPAGDEDQSRLERLRTNEVEYQKEVVQLIRKHGLNMKIIDTECQFDGNKITFFFTAAHRVDFRALVRDLAARYRTRIELRQIGVRDEAQRLDGYGVCGRRQCCNGHLQDFAPISTQHARIQDLSLNPSKISGNCGRLLCCLRYELDLYESVKKQFPHVGATVETTKGTGTIERIDVFAEEALLRCEGEPPCRIKVVDILNSAGKGPRRHSGKAEPPGRVENKEEMELKRLEDSSEETE